MNILFIVRGIDGGGIYMFNLQYAQRLKSMGHRVGAIITSEGKAVQGYKNTFDYSYSISNLDSRFQGKITNKIKNIFTSYTYGKEQALQIKILIEKENIDVIFLNNMTMLFLGKFLKKELNGTPTFLYLHGTVNSTYARTFFNIFLPLYNIIPIANSKYTQKSLGSKCKHVVYPGYEPKRVANGNDKYREQLNIDRGTPVYGIAARISQERAQDMVIRAFIASNAIKKHNAHLIIVGDYICQDYYNKVIESASEFLNKNIHIIGRIGDLNNFYNSIDVYINAITVAEGFGMSVSESLAAGKPVIAYNLGGPSEMIEHNINGWLLTPPTIETYKKAINISLNKKEKWKMMKSKCIESAKRFQVEKNVENLIDIFRSNPYTR